MSTTSKTKPHKSILDDGDWFAPIEVSAASHGSHAPAADVTRTVAAVAAPAVVEAPAPVETQSAGSNAAPGVNYTPSDDLYSGSWYLHSAYGNLDINVEPVWPTYTGRGVHVGVYDSGVQYTHPDLNDNYDASLHFMRIDPNASRLANAHGTSVAGIIAAENDGKGSVGVAYNATITGIVATGTAISGLDDYTQKSLEWAKNFDVTNHSYGLYDVAQPEAQLPWDHPLHYLPTLQDNRAEATLVGIQVATEEGRHGLGTVFVASAGNGRVAWAEDSNGDGRRDFSQNGNGKDAWHEASDANFNGVQTSSRYSIAVANMGIDGSVAFDSNPGANLLVSAPGQSITTTDLTGNAGYNTGNYTTGFNGTSAAAPVVTGVVALMLEANPNLGWRDVKEILSLTARHVGSDIGAGPTNHEFHDWFVNHATDWNGGGRHFSEDYGYGEVDALAAVRLAETWTAQSTSANEVHSRADKFLLNGTTIADGGTPSQVTFFDADQLKVETVTVGLNISHQHLADLHIWMVSPSGTSVDLLRAGTGTEIKNGTATVVTGADMDSGWSFTVDAFAGESSYGSWNIYVQDVHTGVTGTFTDAVLDFYGSKADTNNSYIYTNEFGTLKGVADDASRSTLRDTNGGIDTINVGAVTGGAAINLYTGDAYFAGRTLKIAGGIENLIGTGDADSLQGDNGDNEIRGMRGADTIRGLGGNDTLIGGEGNDTIYGDGGNDTIEVTRYGNDVVDGGADADTLSFASADLGVAVNLANGFVAFDQYIPLVGTMQVGSVTFSSIENLTGSSYDDVLIGDRSDNVIDGHGGSDTMVGGGGSDTFIIDRLGKDIAIGDGGDTLSFANEEGGVTIDLNASSQTFYGYSRTLHKTIEIGSITYSGIDNLVGGHGNDVVTGNDHANRIAGGLGSDTINGGKGNDIIEVLRYGDDTVYGGADRDTLSFIDANAGVAIDMRTGFATFKDGAATVGSVKFYEMENMIGSKFTDTLTGDDNPNAIDGAMGGDTINGMGGDDVIIVSRYETTTVDGGAGSDTLFFSEMYADPSLHTLTIGTLFDLAETSQTFNLMGFNTGSVTFTSIENLHGNNGADTFYGNAQNNVLTGEGGADTLDGRGGNDTILGGAGADKITGGVGDDTLTGGADADTFAYAKGWGADTITDYAVHIDHLDMRGVSGLSSISQLAITDTAQGAKIAFGADTITLTGVKAAQLTDAEFMLTKAPAAANPGVTLHGTAANDILTGTAGNDHIEGGDGINWLTGGAGADELIGGNDTDFIYVDADDTLIDGGGGFDYVYLDSSKSYGASFKVLGTHVEFVTGTLADDVIDASGVTDRVVMNGNYGNDVLIGGNGNDGIDGSADDDTLTGGAGNDTFYFGTGANPGHDTITDFLHGQDVLDMSGYGSGLTSINQLVITDTAAGASIAYGGNSILLLGVHTLDATDFHFMV